MSSTQLLRCTFCFAPFRRHEHLQRHLMSHGGDRPHNCTFCSQSFKRRDVLQRHWRTCKLRLDIGAEIPRYSHASRPNKRRACDRCARLKKACSLSSPCESCRARNHECSYGDSHPAAESGALVQAPSPIFSSFALSAPGETSELEIDQPCFPPLEIPNLNMTSAGETGSWNPSTLDSWAEEPLPSILDSEYALNFPSNVYDAFSGVQSAYPSSIVTRLCFLDHFTSVTGFADSFECGSATEMKDLTRGVQEESFDQNPEKDGTSLGQLSHLNPSSQDILQLSDFTVPTEVIGNPQQARGSLPFFADVPEGMYFGCEDWLSDSLVGVTNNIVSGLKVATQHRSPCSPITFDWSTLIEQICVQFFSPPNIKKYLLFFWSFWYPNCPIIHKPTFDIHNAPHTLLVPMLLIGASLFPDESVKRNAKLWFSSAEEMAFAEEHFQHSITTKGENHPPRRKTLQALQAAYLICLLQNWEGDNNSKQRIRCYRYSMVIAVARNLGFASGNHHEIRLQDMDWHRFILEEELVRTFSFIFLLDTAFVIFNNTPPKLSIAELSMPPVCSERSFQAQSADECLLHLAGSYISMPSANKYSVASVVTKMCQNELGTDNRKYFARLGKLNLFIVISAFHSVLFYSRNTLVPEVAVQPLRQGLSNWKTFWDGYDALEHDPETTGLYSSERWKRTGFMQHAPEYWILTQAILQGMQNPDLMDNNDTSLSAGYLLSRFDETDMSQVNRLIKRFENLNILNT